MYAERLTVTTHKEIVTRVTIHDDLTETYRHLNHNDCRGLVRLFMLYQKEGFIDATTLSILTNPILDAYQVRQKAKLIEIDRVFEELRGELKREVQIDRD